MAAMQDPLMAQTIGQNPQAQQIQAAFSAHIAEHTAYAYRRKIEAQLGMALPPEDEKLPPQIEIALSGMMAQAAQQVLAQSQQQAQQQQAQQQAQDPVVQMQMQELQLKQQELQLKQQKMAADAAAKADEIDLREAEISGRLQLDALKAQAQISDKKAQLEAQQLREGLKMGLDIARDRAQTAQPPTGGRK
jgi:hypothetical protein